MGYAPDGGMAQYMLVPADAVAAGCLFVAREDLPRVLEAISDVLPLSYAVDAMTKVSRDTDPAMWGDLGVVAAFVVAALVLGALTLRRQSE
jgi:ABC-2 type transport system permease protein